MTTGSIALGLSNVSPAATFAEWSRELPITVPIAELLYRLI